MQRIEGYTLRFDRYFPAAEYNGHIVEIGIAIGIGIGSWILIIIMKNR
jgi:hypothetical protein